MKNQKIDDIFNFKKKIILITGSSGQLGKSFTKLFLDLGAIVFGFDKIPIRTSHSNFFFKSVDVSKKINVEKNISSIIKKNKKIDVIINNAAISVFSKFYNRTNSELDKTINTNIKGTLNIINPLALDPTSNIEISYEENELVSEKIITQLFKEIKLIGTDKPNQFKLAFLILLANSLILNYLNY